MSAKPETNPLLKYLAKPTRGQAIKAKCAECMGCTTNAIEPGFRSMIRDCTSQSCPLYFFRPYQLNHERAENGCNQCSLGR